MVTDRPLSAGGPRGGTASSMVGTARQRAPWTVRRSAVAAGTAESAAASDTATPSGLASPARAGAAAGPPTERSPGNPAGVVLGVLSIGPALLAAAWMTATVPLAALGAFRPIAVFALAAAVAAVVVPLGLSLIRSAAAKMSPPWWSVIAIVAVAAGFALFVGATHDQQILLRRDAGSYAQIGYWLAHHAGLNSPVPAAAFGASPGDLTFGSPAFYERGGELIPQFMTGWPTALAAAEWVAGWRGILLLPAVVGGGAILAVGGLAARLVGARWAPLAALLTALAWPVIRVCQTTYSEPLALMMLVSGIALLIDVVAAGSGAGGPAVLTDDGRRRIRRHAFAAGLVLAAGELVRLDFGVDIGLIIPVLGWMVLTRRPGVRAFVCGALVTGLLAVADGAFVTLPYLQTNASSVIPMIAVIALLTVSTAAAVQVLRRWTPAPRTADRLRRVPAIGAVAVVALGVGLAVRPYLWVDHSTTSPATRSFTADLQRRFGLPVDGTRGYAEQSLNWLSWYLGWPLLITALAGAAILTWRVLSRRDPRWLPPLVVFVGSAVETLMRPGITPDHPWADRRLVVEVIPGMILFAVWAAAAATRWTRSTLRASTSLRSTPRSAAGPVPGRSATGPVPGLGWAKATRAVVTAMVAALAVVAFVRPTVAATRPVAALRTELGELAAVRTVCDALRPDDSVVLLDSMWVPTLRAQCGLPVARLVGPSPAALARVTASIRAAGRTPVVAAAGANPLQAQGLAPVQVLNLVTQQDASELIARPVSTQPFRVEFWLVR
ncbi:MAG: hypothetical protein QOI74_859, partial [Micromonosporaceae bacterium]|nr:hypothetical protein [Micromonosporaceae bacterium]